jgi:TonB family protein
MTPQLKAALIACSVAVVLAMPVRVAGQDSLGTARQLYASAEYQGALTMLSALLASNPPPQERQAIELYRVFCLFALGSVDEANRAIDAMIHRDPLYRPNLEEVPRRLRTAFSDARRRLLPSIIQEKYVVAKTAFDQGDFKGAAGGFTQVLIALSDPDIGDAVEQRPLADLRVLAAGFNELTVKAMAPPTPAPEVAAPAPAPEPVVRAPRIYDGQDPNVIAPVVLRQDLPPFSGHVFVRKNARLDIVINETGNVESAAMVQGVDPRYDALVLAAAKGWRYRPASVAGVPIKFRKRIQINLASDP